MKGWLSQFADVIRRRKGVGGDVFQAKLLCLRTPFTAKSQRDKLTQQHALQSLVVDPRWKATRT